MIVGAPGAGPIVLDRRRCVLAHVIAIVDQGRAEIKRGEGPPPLTAEGIVGGVLSLIHARMVEDTGSSLVRDAEAPLIELLGPLMSMLVLPYLGAAVARRELAQPASPISPTPDGAMSAPGDPLRGLDMRLTYRTIRVLLAIDALGGGGSCPSNRQVADHSGIRDQGQVSKLLARLEHLGLIRNAGDGRTKGEPNAWALTDKGADVRTAISGHGSQP